MQTSSSHAPPKRVPVTNPDKLLDPAAKFTKQQVVDYYTRVARWLLPHLKSRPVTLKRYPDGVAGEHFYEKDAPSFTPPWVRTFPVPRRNGGTDIRYIVIDNLATLQWCANLASIELHPFLHRVPKIETPTAIAFDLDPGEGATILDCARVAFLIRDLLGRLNLECLPKVSGSKGVQVYVPLNTPVSYEQTQAFARTVSDLLARQHPREIVAEMSRSLRRNKVFIDWSQNSDFKTTVSVYSLRAKRQTPFVSAPVTWEELQTSLDRRDSKSLYWQPEAALERFSSVGDLFAPVLKLKQRLPKFFVEELSSVPLSAPPKSLREYGNKRHFESTPEPAPSPAPRSSHQGSRRRFVIQKHAASHLHYDFRLEMHNVLKSWAVPKGVPFRTGDTRLAAATEDHPLDYFDFEGNIPKGQYGGGTVMVWDTGTYELIEGNYYKGRLLFHLEGSKLKGEWLLEKRPGDPKNWSLVKTGRSMKPLTAKQDDRSALTSRTMEQIAADNDRQWSSNREEPGLAGLPDAKIAFVEPMLALLVPSLPEGEAWEYEIKFDGYRTLALRDAEGARLLSRNNNDMSDRFAEVAKSVAALDHGTIVDGEIVALDAKGRPSFNVLQNTRAGANVVYFAFDLLAWRGKSLLSLPLEKRRDLLRKALDGPPGLIHFSDTLKAEPESLIRAVREQGLEGIVAKRINSVYEPGKRSGAWVKVKVNRDAELIIGGYKAGASGFDNLAAGYRDEAGRLIFIAKIKNGFTPAMKAEIAKRLKPLETTKCPFDNLPEPKTARRGEALTAEAMKKYRWVKPSLKAVVEFTDWTDANHLRHSRFVKLL